MKKATLFSLVAICLISVISGCNPFAKKPKDSLGESLNVPKNRLLGEYASPGASSQNPIIVDGWGLAIGLGDNGCVEPDTHYRSYVYNNLARAQVNNINHLIDSKDTAIVRLQGKIRPGANKGEPFDVQVTLPRGSEAKSLRGGYLYKTSLSEMMDTGSSYREGKPWAFVEGPLLLDPSIDKTKTPEAEKVAMIIGRALNNRERHLTLVIDEGIRNFRVAQELQTQINRRFKIPGEPKGVAEAKNFSLIEVNVHPDYRDVPNRYLAVILSIRCFTNEAEQAKRLEQLKDEVLDPNTTMFAAMQLEALPGKAGVDALEAGLKSNHADVRFYCAESLAFLNKTGIAKTLAEIAEKDKTKRQSALMALGVMSNGIEASEALMPMLDAQDPMLRYAAFRTLWQRDPSNPAIRGEALGVDKISYHLLNTNTKPMVHVSKSRREEIVLFSPNIAINAPFIGNAGTRILVEVPDGNQARLVRVNPGRMSETRTLPNSLDAILRGIAELGGNYQDMLDFLNEANATQSNGTRALSCEYMIDAYVQEKERSYRAGVEEEEEEETKKTEPPKKKSAMQRMNPATWFSKDKKDEKPEKEKLSDKAVDDSDLVDDSNEDE